MKQLYKCLVTILDAAEFGN